MHSPLLLSLIYFLSPLQMFESFLSGKLAILEFFAFIVHSKISLCQSFHIGIQALNKLMTILKIKRFT